MKLTRAALAIAVLAVAVAFPLAARSSGDSVGLGLSLGVALPQGSTTRIASTDWRPSFDWGFYVNIPLIATFHLTPSAELYKFADQNATDMAIAFKFIVPLWRLDLYAGFVPGLTTVADVTAFHVGVLAGGSFRLIANLDLFTQVKYIFLFEGDQSMRGLRINAGILFKF
jgi:hypothetical protein